MGYTSIEELLESYKTDLSTYLAATQIIGRRKNVVVDQDVEENIQKLSKSISIIQKLANENWEMKITDRIQSYKPILQKDSISYINESIINSRVILDTVELERITGNRAKSITFIQEDGKSECMFNISLPNDDVIRVIPKYLDLDSLEIISLSHPAQDGKEEQPDTLLTKYRKEMHLYLVARELIDKANKESQVTFKTDIVQINPDAMDRMTNLSISIKLLEKLEGDGWSLVTDAEMLLLENKTKKDYRINYTWRQPGHIDGELIVNNALIIKGLSLDAITLQELLSPDYSDFKIENFEECFLTDQNKEVLGYFRASLPTGKRILIKARHLTEPTEELQTIELRDGNHAWLNKAAIGEIQTHLSSNKAETVTPVEEKKHSIFSSLRKKEKPDKTKV